MSSNFVSMNLSETVTYPTLEGVSSCGSISMLVFICSVALVGELDLKWPWVTSTPWMCWQFPTWWEVGLEMEWLEPESGVNQKFSFAQWQSLSYESPLDWKEVKPVNPKGNKSWIFIGRTDTEAPILCKATWCKELTQKRPWCWERLQAGGEGDDRRWDGWMASPTWWTSVWASSRSSWWTGKPGMLQSMGLWRVGHDWATELNWSYGGRGRAKGAGKEALRVRSELLSFHLRVHTLLGNIKLHPSWESCWSRRGWRRCSGMVPASQSDPEAVFSLLSPCCDWEQVSLCTFFKNGIWFLIAL